MESIPKIEFVRMTGSGSACFGMFKSKEWPSSKVPRLTKGKKDGNRMGRRRNTDKIIRYRIKKCKYTLG